MDSDQKEGNPELSHLEAMAGFRHGLREIIENDSLLWDLPNGVTLEEINAQIALEHGQAMTVNIRKADGKVYPLVVKREATVRDLKQALKRYVQLRWEIKSCKLYILQKRVFKHLCRCHTKIKNDEWGLACQSFFWYDNDKHLKICIFVPHISFF